MIKQVTRENGQLREQLTYLQVKEGPHTFLMNKVTFLMKELKQAIIEYYKLKVIIE
jgi:hypothetical protein